PLSSRSSPRFPHDSSLSYLRLTVFFFLLMQRPPISTLFPYTTLFRSVQDADDECQTMQSIAECWLRFNSHSSLVIEKKWLDATRDRKSTRLNSSHVSISYAVVCLKKKKRAKR